MPYKRKIYKSGNSEVVSIPPTLLKELGIAEGDFVNIVKSKNSINIKPAKKAEELSLEAKLEKIRKLSGIVNIGLSPGIFYKRPSRPKKFDIKKALKEMEREYGR